MQNSPGFPQVAVVNAWRARLAGNRDQRTGCPAAIVVGKIDIVTAPLTAVLTPLGCSRSASGFCYLVRLVVRTSRKRAAPSTALGLFARPSAGRRRMPTRLMEAVRAVAILGRRTFRKGAAA